MTSRLAADPMFFPDRTGGLKARAQVQARLAESLAHVFEQCRGTVPFDEQAANALLEMLMSGRQASPALYGRYFRAVKAILELGTDPDDDAIAAIADRLGLLLSQPYEASGSIDVRPLTPSRFPGGEETEFREEFLTESLTDSEVLTVDDARARELASAIENALTLIREHAPNTWAEFEQVIAEIVPADGAETADGLRFGGCSSLERWGSMLINVSDAPTEIMLCEALMHEGAHSYLFGASPVDFAVRNDMNERYKSPLRVDPRPLEGIYHATFVLARMCYGMHEFAASSTLDEDRRNEALLRAEESRALFWDGYAVLRDHADYTEPGREIMRAAHDYIAGIEPLAAE